MPPATSSAMATSPSKQEEGGNHPQVADPALEFLIAEIVRYAELSCPPEGPTEEHAIFACEMAAAKLERIGYSVGYRLCERLAQHKTFGAAGGAGGSSSKKDPAAAVAASQLEAVKFVSSRQCSCAHGCTVCCFGSLLFWRGKAGLVGS